MKGLYLWALLFSTPMKLPAESWASRLSRAQELQRAGDLSGAQREFGAALDGARQLGANSVAVAQVLDRMGVFYTDIDNVSAAEFCYKKALAIWTSRLGPEHFGLARILIRLASLYIETRQLNKADQLDLETWVRRLELVDPRSLELIRLQQTLAALWSLHGQSEKAERYLRRALDLAGERGSNTSEERAAILHNAGLACLRARQYDSAIRNFTGSMTLWEQVGGPHDSYLASSGHMLALAYQGAGRRKDAEFQLHRAITIAERSFGALSPRTAAILKSYASLLREQRRTSEAKAIEARLRRIQRESGNSPSRHTVDLQELSVHK